MLRMPHLNRFLSSIFDPRFEQPNIDLPRIAVLPRWPNFPRLRSAVQNNGVSGMLLLLVIQSRIHSLMFVEKLMH